MGSMLKLCPTIERIEFGLLHSCGCLYLASVISTILVSSPLFVMFKRYFFTPTLFNSSSMSDFVFELSFCSFIFLFYMQRLDFLGLLKADTKPWLPQGLL